MPDSFTDGTKLRLKLENTSVYSVLGGATRKQKVREEMMRKLSGLLIYDTSQLG